MSTSNKRIIIAGGSGLIGSACRKRLLKSGYEILILTRRTDTQEHEITWDPARRDIEENVIDGSFAVINLCGLPLPDRRWTDRYKTALRDSRVEPAAYLSSLCAEAHAPPECYIGASAIGIYGDRGNTPLTEDDVVHPVGFAAELVQDWERAHQQVSVIRNFILRIGIVVSRDGGFIAKVLPPSRFGIYPCFGRGDQIISWIQIDDLAGMVLHLLQHEVSPGTYNASAPGSLAQRALMQTLRQVSGRPGVMIPVPELALRIVFGEMASMLFESADVRPDKILDTGFSFEMPDMTSALRQELRR